MEFDSDIRFKHAVVLSAGLGVATGEKNEFIS